MKMQNDAGDNLLVRKVLGNILQAYPEKSESVAATRKSLEEALVSLTPFKPNEKDTHTINSILIKRQSSDIACKSAWALYKDYVLNAANKRTHSQG